MKYYHNLNDINLDNTSSVITVGMFDGVHVGHLSVLQKVVEISKAHGIPSIVLTFSNHPASYFQANSTTEQLATLDEKKNLLAQLGIDIVVALPFDSYMASLSARQFVNSILIHYFHVEHIVFGYDNHFGHNREGSKDFIDAQFPTIKSYRVSETVIGGEIVSSSLIKQYVKNGLIEKANQLLDYPYRLIGKIIKGDQLGRTIGYPTANIEIVNDKLIPSKGVYFTRSFLESEMFYGMTNIGIRPTVTQSRELRVETNLFNFEREIYGQELKVEFLARMRDEVKFNSFPELVNQLQQDKLDALNRLAQIHITT